jgi:hypothetical protein
VVNDRRVIELDMIAPFAENGSAAALVRRLLASDRILRDNGSTLGYERWQIALIDLEIDAMLLRHVIWCYLYTHAHVTKPVGRPEAYKQVRLARLE